MTAAEYQARKEQQAQQTQQFNNRPAQPANRPQEIAPVTYLVGDTEVTLDVQTIKNFLVNGDANNVTMQEFIYFMNLCKAQGLNPFVKDAYLIKYGTQPATVVTSVGALEKRAENFPEFDGIRSGVVVVNNQTGDVKYRDGALFLNRIETLVGAWAEVYRKDRKMPTHVEISFDEFAGRKKDGSLNTMWATKPAVMIRKCAKTTALREAFPNQNGGLYGAEELSQSTPQVLEDKNMIVEEDR
jgi:phage recombination protein Bet